MRQQDVRFNAPITKMCVSPRRNAHFCRPANAREKQTDSSGLIFATLGLLNFPRCRAVRRGPPGRARSKLSTVPSVLTTFEETGRRNSTGRRSPQDCVLHTKRQFRKLQDERLQMYFCRICRAPERFGHFLHSREPGSNAKSVIPVVVCEPGIVGFVRFGNFTMGFCNF